jgi:hypothetical protein
MRSNRLQTRSMTTHSPFISCSLGFSRKINFAVECRVYRTEAPSDFGHARRRPLRHSRKPARARGRH